MQVVGVTLVNVAPPEVYAVPDVFVISSDVVKAVVAMLLRVASASHIRQF